MDNQNNQTEENQQQTPQEEEKYLGRFTRGNWYGGICGIAFSYFLIGVIGLISSKFSLNLDKYLYDSTIRYGLMIVFALLFGKIGGILEKKK